MKIGILTGEVPSRPFIENLILSLAGQKNVDLVVFGKQKRRVRYPSNIKVFNYGGSRLKLWLRRKIYPLVYSTRWAKMKPFISRIKSRNYGGNIDLALGFARHELDIVHYQWIDIDPSLIQMNKALGSAVIGSLRGYQINVKPIVFSYIDQKYTQLFAHFDAFHAVSKAIIEKVAQFGVPEEKCRVIYSGTKLNLSVKKNVDRDEAMHLTSVGRGNWIKGYDLALDAMKILKDKGIKLRYSIVIGNPTEELLFLRKELGLEKEVDFLPKMSHPEVLDHISSASAMLLPSHEEGVANVALEAMSLRIPVISADCGGMPEVIEHEKSGLLFRASDAQCMATAISRFYLSSKKEREEWADAALFRIKQYHRIDSLGENMVFFYRDVLRKRNQN